MNIAAFTQTIHHSLEEDVGGHRNVSLNYKG